MRYRAAMSSTIIKPRPSVSFEMTAAPSRAKSLRLALADFTDACGMARLCWSLALLDIKLRYRGSVLGPFWLTLSTAVMIGSMGVLYALLFHMDMHSYFPFLALSIVLWNFLSQLITESCTCFVAAESTIRSVRMPFSLYAARVVLRNLIVFGHNVVVIVLVDLILGTWPSWLGLLAIPAFLLWLVVGFAVVILLGAVCARFRDIPPIVASIMQMAFFISGVMWQPSQLHSYEYLLALNPFFSLLEIVRGPLLGEIPSWTIYASAFGYSALLILLSGLLFARVRGRIAFWV